MTNYEWDAHKAKWCERCKHNNNGKCLLVAEATEDKAGN